LASCVEAERSQRNCYAYRNTQRDPPGRRLRPHAEVQARVGPDFEGERADETEEAANENQSQS
jgi:hypothetical protein